MIYLDNSATTIPDESVVQSFKQVSEKYFANPSSIHELGADVERLQTKAREQAATLLQIDPSEIIFTSGGTEGNNLAIKGVALKYQGRGNHIITTEIEHASVYETCKSLEELGFTVTYLPVNSDGVVDVQMVRSAITNKTILISIMHVNNETGSIQPIEEIGEIAKKHPKLFFHVDAVQALGKVPLQLHHSGIDLCTFSGHKIHGLKGTGMLYIKKGTVLYPLFHGGNQEQGLRSGTENVAGNVSFVRALRLMMERKQKGYGHLQKIHQNLFNHLGKIDGVYINSSEHGAPHIMNVSVPGLKPEVVIHALFEKGIVISTQSACSSKQSDKSRVLDASGRSSVVSSSGLRISLSYDTSEKEIEIFIRTFTETIKHLKDILE
ncbi:cysteine desulfurase family protein [Pseudogracilibacillus auburnensis]|uniref:Cysteine desulfurase n=1 Tax=Pseudogracilibacillus auburnensis TaxID=1494959 RepID=A0A2V3W9B9_9BACI|nr:cysteine desulfurase family protein [Pseudogracilibacillus auburnensis]MBO1003358.1 cysteine desulfurase [Pseudogracilibacillus auburnensis]PXW85339.1 cysteine desulfurase [Pseudogracilibacillus auburnensis]